MLNAAARTTAIIASLFPKQVQRRLLQEAEEKAKMEIQEGTSMRGHRRAGKSELKDFLGEKKEKGKGKASDERNPTRIKRGKAIADLFPSTTM